MSQKEKFVARIRYYRTSLKERIPEEDSLQYSIFVTIFCCPPLGLWAIYNQWKAREDTKKSNYDAAKAKVELAKTLNEFGVVVGFLIWIIICIVIAARFAFLQKVVAHFASMFANHADVFRIYEDYPKSNGTK
ncbi:uncharacterized protein LOC120327935 [Styela clava]|uniref:uncharacterized protein LOC120327935 n=1 Tax=Styela clava TaxID=7725 RepID=UPI001939E445|nr:uncharacterized protein LOC120327935 [Styela clava]